MVSTEEERLPIRVPVSVRGLNASEPFPIPIFVFAFSHIRIACMPCFVHGQNSNTLSRQFCSLKVPLVCSTFFLYVLRSIPAM